MAKYGESMDAYIWRAELGIPNKPELEGTKDEFEEEDYEPSWNGYCLCHDSQVCPDGYMGVYDDFTEDY